jgi:hypothetical protein
VENIDMPTREIDEFEYESRIRELENRLSILETMQQAHCVYTGKALDKAEMMVNERLLRMNEVRDQLKDQAATFLTTVEYVANHKALETKIESLQKFMWLSIGALAVIQVLIGFIDKYLP